MDAARHGLRAAAATRPRRDAGAGSRRRGFPDAVLRGHRRAGGGGQVLFGDGHVQFISTSINLNTWAALSSMNLGDVPGAY